LRPESRRAAPVPREPQPLVLTRLEIRRAKLARPERILAWALSPTNWNQDSNRRAQVKSVEKMPMATPPHLLREIGGGNRFFLKRVDDSRRQRNQDDC